MPDTPDIPDDLHDLLDRTAACLAGYADCSCDIPHLVSSFAFALSRKTQIAYFDQSGNSEAGGAERWLQ